MNLMVSIGIMLTFALLTIPYYQKYQPNLELSATAKNLVTDLRYAQQLNINEQITHIVEFNLLENKYEILKLDTTTSTIKSVNLVSGINFEEFTGLSNGNQVRFNSYGGVSDAGTITLINSNDKTAIIDIKPSGYINLQ